MASQWIDLRKETMIVINVPLVFFNLAANIFYTFCLISNRQKLKQPLMTLLGGLIWCTTAYFVFLAVMFWMLKDDKYLDIPVVLVIVAAYMHQSMTCSVWLNFYYFVLIVPSQRALFIWIKRNVKAVVYTVLFLGGMLILVYGGLKITAWMFYSTSAVWSNGTWTIPHNEELYNVNNFCFWLVTVHLLMCFCIMIFSSFFTVHYLYGHIRRMAQGGFSSPKTQSQIRVTITGISQGVLYFIFGFLCSFCWFTANVSLDFTLGPFFGFTVSSLYLSGTTVNLGVGEVDGRMVLASYVVFVSSLPINMTSSVWLNFFYCTQIVPAQRFVFVWIKKNIKPIIYCIWAAERICTLINAFAVLLDCGRDISFSFQNSNITMFHDIELLDVPPSELYFTVCSMFIFTNIGYFLICLCVMLISSSCTAVYLCRHLHRLISNGLPITCPRLRSHVRVTIFGILQGVLCMSCTIWVIYRIFNVHILSVPFLSTSNFTAINFYMTSSTCTLGAGQAVFRQRAADLFQRADANGDLHHSPKFQSNEVTDLMCQSSTHEEDTKADAATKLKMDFLACILLNCSLVILSCLAGAFYIFCIVCSSHQERLKQPLKLLLGTLICGTVAYQMSVPVLIISREQAKDEKRWWPEMVRVFMNFCMTAAMNSSVWLSFFYYTQIVPPQRALFIWIKKNIKQIIYGIWLVEGMINLFRDVVKALTISFDNLGCHNNFTIGYCHLTPGPIPKYVGSISVFFNIVHSARFIVCLCLMLISSASTAVYLCRHIHHMAGSARSFSCPRLKSQVRVTILGILQGLMFMAYVLWVLYIAGTRNQQSVISRYTFPWVTAMNFYMTGTMLNLGAGQAVFRQRVADLWDRVSQWCRAPERQESEEEEHAPEIHSSRPLD
ncbi:uncharacterized protein V6R79_006181 [Siganus canaliculatus]